MYSLTRDKMKDNEILAIIACDDDDADDEDLVALLSCCMDDDTNEVAAVAGLLSTATHVLMSGKQYQSRVNSLTEHLDMKGDMEFFQCFHLSRPCVMHVLERVVEAGCFNPIPRHWVSPKTGLYMTLLYLRNQCTYQEMADRFGYALETVYDSIQKVMKVLANMRGEVIRWPSHNDISETEKRFRQTSGIPGILGVLDGCNILIRARKKDAADYLDSSDNHSITLLAACDDHNNFIFAHSGFPGSLSKQEALNSTMLKPKLQEDEANDLFPGRLYYLAGEAAFELLPHLMVPFSLTTKLTKQQLLFNSKMQVVTKVIHKAFSLLKTRFPRLTFIEAQPKNRNNIVYACCVLHNLALALPGDQEVNVSDVGVNVKQTSNTDKLTAYKTREKIANSL